MRSTVLFVPGLRDFAPDHWQTLLAEDIPGSRSVPPLAGYPTMGELEAGGWLPVPRKRQCLTSVSVATAP